MAKIVSWNADQLVAKAALVAKLYSKELSDEFKEQITAVKYNWPNVTFRKNGEEVESPRDIYDTGRFYRSQTLRFTDKGAVIKWNAPYSRAILDGSREFRDKDGNLVKTKDGKELRVGGGTARDWITPGLRNMPIVPNFLRMWQRFPISGGATTY